MGTEWPNFRLGDLINAGEAHLQTGPFGTALKAAEYSTTGVPLISVREIREGYFAIGDDTPRVSEATIKRLPKFVLEAGDIVFGRKGGIDRNAMVHSHQQGWFLGSDGIRLRLSKLHHSRFFSYQMRSPAIRTWLLQHCEGTTMPSLNQDILGRIPIVVPPPATQRAIAHILGTLDDKIELNRKMNETLETMARALFKSWFIDFDPVRAKADGRKPVGMDEATAKLFPDSLKESKVGPVPRGWVPRTLRELADVTSGGTPSKDTAEFWDGDIPWVSPKSMNYIHVDNSEDRVTQAAVGNGTRLVPKGTVLVMVRGMGLHQGVRISQAQRDVTFNQDVKAVVARSVNNTFLLYALLHASDYLSQKVHAAGHGTGVLSTEILDGLTFVIPAEDAIEPLARPLDDLNSRIAANSRQALSLTELRDALLPKLLSGEIRIKDAEQFVGG